MSRPVVLRIDVQAVQDLGRRVADAAETLRLLAGAAGAALASVADAAEVDGGLAARAGAASAEERARMGRIAEWARSVGHRLPAAAAEFARCDAASAPNQPRVQA